MGKSTFGNYLFDPDEEHMFEKKSQTFVTATDNKPMTQEVKVVRQKVQVEGVGKVELKLIDTPGLNESAERDLSHMMQIIETINECEEITACIFVVKFNAKIDAQYRATIEYYSKLLPGLFDNNVIIVMTDFATDERSEKQRERQRINVEEVKRNTILEIGKCSNNQISYSPQLFTIDCLPMTSAEKETSQTVRNAILSYIFQLPPTKVSNLMVAKTDCIKQKDAKKYQRLQGEIIGYQARLKEAHRNSEKVLDDTRQKEMEITETESKINNLETNLRSKDTADEVVAAKWSVAKKWKMFERQNKEFNVESPYRIKNYSTWTDGNCKLKDLNQTTYAVSGKCEGSNLRGLYASITTYTEKRIKYADEIEDLKKRIIIENTNLTRCRAELEDFQKTHKDNLKEIGLLQDYMAERRADARKCQSEYMTLDEALSRLEELQK